MDRLHARYPFLRSARRAVEEMNVDLREVIADEPAVVRRGKQRVTTGLSEGHVGDMHRSTRVELLSYPIGRILVSMLDEPMAVATYARAEATTARTRFEADVETTELRSTKDRRIDLDRLLREFELETAVERTDGALRMAVAPYLQLSGGLEDTQWRLIDRALHDGMVPIEQEELFVLLEEAVADRVSDGLPLRVPEEIGTELTAQREDIEELLTEHEFTLGFDTIAPAAFPPCMKALLDRIRDGASLSQPGQFALVAFLAGTGIDAAGLHDLFGGQIDKETLEYQLAHLQDGETGEYAPPSCAGMQAYDLCVNRDERCDRINHPVTYYQRALSNQ